MGKTLPLLALLKPQCQGPSMLPTLNDQGDVLLVDKLTPKFRPYTKNEIVVVRSPHTRGEKVCKRIKGLEGDTFCARTVLFAVQVPRGHLWIEGDNPQNSSDSRHYGPLPLALVEGRVVARIWPLNKFKRFNTERD
eukprot:gb/GECG01012857.1/.p1 GENE.gb/GECG01012857.1/~~gb/GECG01012857.1/.p1  ORF type:complete len:136 (+),score=8.22 gb/GECG01012857.1/:1-408(+)